MFAQVSFSQSLLLVTVASALAAQPPGPNTAQTPTTIASFVVQGNASIAAEEVVRLCGLHVGDAVGKKEIHAAAERLMATGRFHRVDYRWKPLEAGIEVTFAIAEREAQIEDAPVVAAPKIASVEFEGASAIPADRLRAILAPALDDRIYREEDFRSLLDSLLLPAYRDKGHLRAGFPSVRTEGAGPVSVVVRVEEGPAYRVGRVGVDGADPAFSKLLGLQSGQVAKRESLDASRKRLADLLARRGWLQASIQLEERFREGEVDLAFRVAPGPPFRFRELTIRGLDESAEKRARKLWRLKPGDPMDPQAMDDFVRAVLQARIAVGIGATREMKIASGSQEVEVIVQFK